MILSSCLINTGGNSVWFYCALFPFAYTDITVALIDNPTCGTYSVFDSIPGMLQGIQYQKEQLYCLPLIRLKT